MMFAIRASALGCALFAAFFSCSAQNSQQTPAKGQITTCAIDQALPTEGELALAKKDYPAAETFFRAAIKTDPASEDAHLGLVRALIGENNVTGARTEADAMLAQHPHSAVAEVAVGEADFRAADFDGSSQHITQALKDNSCEGRAAAGAARIWGVNAFFAKEARFLDAAHRFRPNDELIRRDWIETLPRKERAAELAKYLGETHALSNEDRTDYTNAEEHLKARRPGECRITSKADKVRIPFKPVFGESTRPTAYGLDVSFNGKNRRMQIDTGASGIVLTAGAAKRLGLEPEYRIKSSGVGDEGKVGSYLSHVASIRIGDVEVSDCMVEVLEKAKMDVDGLIGIDVFDRWLVTLDYPDAELRLEPLPARPGSNPAPALNSLAAGAGDSDDEHPPQDRYIAPEMQDWLRVVRIDHELLLPAQLNRGPFHYLMADTGASESTFAPSFAKEAGKIYDNPYVRFSGISGEVKKVYRIDNAELTFGTLRLPPNSFSVFDITSVSHETGAEVSGFVGLPTLSRLTISIDYRDNLMQLKYDPKKDYRRF
jgi:gag-polyprotein putative aspartyl protease/Tetratricopeptide repeat/Aspartyl protease